MDLMTILRDLLDRVSEAESLVDVNIAAGIAREELGKEGWIGSDVAPGDGLTVTADPVRVDLEEAKQIAEAWQDLHIGKPRSSGPPYNDQGVPM